MLFRCSPYHTHSAFFPVIVYLQRRLHWHHGRAPEARVTTLEQALRPYGFALPGRRPPLCCAALRAAPRALSPPHAESPAAEAADAGSPGAWLLAEAERQPVLVVWEDLHWADPSSLDLLQHAYRPDPHRPLLLLLACRPEFAPPGPRARQVTQLTLPAYPPADRGDGAAQAGGKRVPAEVVQQISAKTDGVPLFVEELTKTILESGLLRETTERYEFTGPLPALAIPTTLQDALMARLDRLGTAKGLRNWAPRSGASLPMTSSEGRRL